MAKRASGRDGEAETQLAEMEQYQAQLLEREREVEVQAKNLATSQELAAVQGKLSWSEQTREYLMTTGISQSVAKCHANHEFRKLVGRLMPSIQAMGKTELLRQLQSVCFSNVNLEKVPGYDAKDEDLAEAVFQSFRHELIEFHILSELVTRPETGAEEIGELENSDLLSGQGSE